MKAMEAWAPPSLAESWDNPGLAAGEPDARADRALVTLDVTDEALDAAVQTGASIIISHHPTIFKPLATLAGSSYSAQVVRRAIHDGISLYSAHTNLDRAHKGVSHAAAERLGLHSIEPLVP